MKTIKMQVTYKELCWMLEGLDDMIRRYKDCNSEIEKVRAHIVRKLLMMEREDKKKEADNDK